MKKILFVCTSGYRAGKLSSLFKKDYETKISGIMMEKQHLRKLIYWADYITCIDDYHREELINNYQEDIRAKNIICLNLTGNVDYDSKETLNEIKKKIINLIKEQDSRK